MDALTNAAAELVRIPVEQMYAYLWRAGVVEVD